MAKRPSQRQYPFISLPFSSEYGGTTFSLEPGGIVPLTYFQYRGGYAEITDWFGTWLREDPKLLPKLRSSATAEVKRKLLDLIEEDAAFKKAPGTTKEYVKSTITGLPESALQQIIADLCVAPRGIPATLPLWTFQEARAMMFAIANRPDVEKSESGWEVSNSDPVDLVWTSPKDDWKVLYRPSTPRNLRSADECKSDLNAHRLKAVLCFQIVLNAVINTGEVTLSLSELARVLSFSLQTAPDRIEAHRTIWRWLQNFDSMIVVGKRHAKYQGTTVSIDDFLIKIVGGTQGTERRGQNEPPTTVTIRPSRWLSTYRNDRRVLPFFGDIRPLTDLSGGQPRSAWALSIGLGLLQEWRENASRYKLGRTGDTGKLTAKTGVISRRELFDLFPPDISVRDILFGVHPEKAIHYWDNAIELLQAAKLVGHYTELKMGYQKRRQGWQNDWLDSELEIRPDRAMVPALVAISQKARRKTGLRNKPANNKQDSV